MVRLLNNFTQVCKTENEVEFCSCDYRVNIYECSNSEFYVVMGKILVTICIIETMMAIGSLIYLIKVKKQPFFLVSTRERGWLRPRPLHSYHLIIICFMFFEAVHLLALIYESYPTIAAAEVGNISKNIATNATAVFYAVSIVYSTPKVKFSENYEILYEKKKLNTRLVDIIGIILFFLPMIVGFPIALLTGHFAEINDFQMANIFFKLHYLFDVVEQIIYLVVLAYFYHKLMIVINSYVKMLEERNISSSTIDDGQLEKVKKCTKNITLPVAAIVTGLSFQSIIYITFSIIPRTTTIYYFGWNIFFYCTEYVAYPLLGFLVESFLIYYTLKNIKTSPNSSRKSGVPSLSSEQISNIS